MTSISTLTSAPILANRYAVGRGSVERPNPGAVSSLAETGLSGFGDELKRVAAGAGAAPDPAVVARSRAVQAHTVFRQGDQVVGVVWRDGQVQLGNGLASRFDWSAMERRTGGMTDAQRRESIAQDLTRQLGGAITVERYGEAGTAPTRGGLEDEQSRQSLKARRRI